MQHNEAASIAPLPCTFKKEVRTLLKYLEVRWFCTVALYLCWGELVLAGGTCGSGNLMWRHQSSTCHARDSADLLAMPAA